MKLHHSIKRKKRKVARKKVDTLQKALLSYIWTLDWNRNKRAEKNKEMLKGKLGECNKKLHQTYRTDLDIDK